MNNIEICKEYFALHKAIVSEKQFNKKVDLNIKAHQFKIKNHIILRGSEPIIEVFIGAGIESVFVGQIVTKYAKKDKDLECKKIGFDYKLINS
jgi:hypothetical protein